MRLHAIFSIGHTSNKLHPHRTLWRWSPVIRVGSRRTIKLTTLPHFLFCFIVLHLYRFFCRIALPNHLIVQPRHWRFIRLLFVFSCSIFMMMRTSHWGFRRSSLVAIPFSLMIITSIFIFSIFTIITMRSTRNIFSMLSVSIGLLIHFLHLVTICWYAASTPTSGCRWPRIILNLMRTS